MPFTMVTLVFAGRYESASWLLSKRLTLIHSWQVADMGFKYIADEEICPCGTSGKKFKKCCKRSNNAHSFDRIGSLLFKQGRQAGAVECLRHAISLDPDIPEFHSKLGVVYLTMGNFRAAEKCQRRTVKMCPTLGSAHSNLGITLVTLQEYQQAAESFQTALSLQPDHESARQHIARVLYLQGKNDEALLRFRELLSQQMDLIRAGKAQPAQVRPPMQVAMGYKVLQLAKQRLEKAGLPFFLSLGTLLGVVRDGDLLPFDKDLDIGTFWEIERQRVVAAMTRDRVFSCSRWDTTQDRDAAWKLGFQHTTSQISIDIFFHKTDGEYFLAGFDHLPEPFISRPHKFGIGTIDWRGEAWPVPEDSERYLSDYYGSRWRTPDKNFDTIISSKCQLSETRRSRIAYGYVRLHELFASQRWSKIVSVCEQVLALDPEDEFVGELRDFALHEDSSTTAIKE